MAVNSYLQYSCSPHHLSAVLRIWRSLIWFQMVSLEFFFDMFFLIALCFWVPLNFRQNWVPGEFSGDKCGRCFRLTTLQPSSAVMKSRNLNFLVTSGPLQACNGIALPFTPSFIQTLYSTKHTTCGFAKSGTNLFNKMLSTDDFLCSYASERPNVNMKWTTGQTGIKFFHFFN